MTESSLIKVLEVNEYGDDIPDGEDLNLKGMLVRRYDNAGSTLIGEYDFKGFPRYTSQELLEDHTIVNVDWAGTPTLDAEVFTTTVTIDALGRPVTQTDAGGNVTEYTYDKAGALKAVEVNTDSYVNDIHYNARGQREAIWYGNETKTAYTYDDKTYRLTRLLTTKSSDVYQDLRYWYDPVGNITHIQDDAQQTLYYSGSVVAPDQDFTYDALYRLITAEGRELIGTATFGTDDNIDDASWKTSHVGNGAAVQNYTQSYEYDEVGNILELQHSATAGSYTRTCDYDTASNRLDSTTVGANTYDYTYDGRGNMITMPHLPTMEWNAQNELHHTNNGTSTLNTYFNYSGGQRIRKVCLKPGRIKEVRIYLGSYELYRKYNNGVLDIERTTVHVSDDMGRIAMLEERTVGTDSAPASLQRYIYSNHLSTASLELDENAAIISYEEYHPYGTTSYQAMNASINAVAKRYRYTGKERDEETGLYYHGARYYIPWLCRWTAVDPMENKYAGMSPYNYGYCNPITWQDANGMDPEGTTSTTTYSTPNGGKVSIPSSDDHSSIEADKVFFGSDNSESITFGQTSLIQFTISEGDQIGVFKAQFYINKDGSWTFEGYRNQFGNFYKEGKQASSEGGGGGGGGSSSDEMTSSGPSEGETEEAESKPTENSSGSSESGVMEAVSNIAKSFAANQDERLNRYQLEPKRGSTETGIRDTKGGKLRKGKMTGQWIVRFDHPDPGSPNPHIVIKTNPNNKLNTHIDIPNNVLKFVSKFARFMEKVGKVARPVAIALDAIRLISAFQEDNNRFGKHTLSASASIIGGTAGAIAGTYIGAKVGMLVGGIIGSIFPVIGTAGGAAIGGFIGGFVGSLWGAYKGSQLSERLVM